MIVLTVFQECNTILCNPHPSSSTGISHKHNMINTPTHFNPPSAQVHNRNVNYLNVHMVGQVLYYQDPLWNQMWIKILKVSFLLHISFVQLHVKTFTYTDMFILIKPVPTFNFIFTLWRTKTAVLPVQHTLQYLPKICCAFIHLWKILNQNSWHITNVLEWLGGGGGNTVRGARPDRHIHTLPVSHHLQRDLVSRNTLTEHLVTRSTLNWMLPWQSRLCSQCPGYSTSK
jgi:hypothetical protein